MNLFRQSQIMHDWPTDNLAGMISQGIERRFLRGELVYAPGDSRTEVYFIKEGEVEVRKSGVLGALCYFLRVDVQSQ